MSDTNMERHTEPATTPNGFVCGGCGGFFRDEDGFIKVLTEIDGKLSPAWYDEYCCTCGMDKTLDGKVVIIEATQEELLSQW